MSLISVFLPPPPTVEVLALRHCNSSGRWHSDWTDYIACIALYYKLRSTAGDSDTDKVRHYKQCFMARIILPIYHSSCPVAYYE